MLAQILLAVITVLRTLWRVAVNNVTRRNWPIWVAGIFFAWYILSKGPTQVVEGVGRAIGVTFKSVGDMLYWLGQELGVGLSWLIHQVWAMIQAIFSAIWKSMTWTVRATIATARFAMALIPLVLAVFAGFAALCFAYPAFFLTFGVPILIILAGGLALIFWR